METYTLSNGVRIIIDQMDFVNTISISIMVRVGAKNEDELNNGISHLIEHLIIGNDSDSLFFDKIGAKFNGFTSREYTCYYLRMVRSHFKKSVEFFFDKVLCQGIDTKKIELEKKVIEHEIALHKDNIADLTKLGSLKASYGSHPITNEILGTTYSLQNINKNDLQSYYSDYYASDNIVICASGNLGRSNIETLLSIASELNGGKCNAKEVSKPIFIKGSSIKKIEQVNQTHVCISYECKGRKSSIEQQVLYYILNAVLGGNRTSRLSRSIRGRHGISYSLYSYLSLYEDTGLLNIYAATSNHEISNLLNNLYDEILHLSREGISKSELYVAKENLKSDFEFGLENSTDRSLFFGQNAILQGNSFDKEELLNMISELKLNELNNKISDFFAKNYSSHSIISAGEVDENPFLTLDP